MQLDSSLHDDALIVSVPAERIDSAAAIRFKDAMRRAARDGPERVILDLGNVRFVDSSGLGAIVAVMKHLAPAQRLELADMSPDVEKVFRLTRMDTVFTIHPGAGVLARRAGRAGGSHA